MINITKKELEIEQELKKKIRTRDDKLYDIEVGMIKTFDFER